METEVLLQLSGAAIIASCLTYFLVRQLKLVPLTEALKQAELSRQQAETALKEQASEYLTHKDQYHALELQAGLAKQQVEDLSAQLHALRLTHDELSREAVQYREQLATTRTQLSEQQKQMEEKVYNH